MLCRAAAEVLRRPTHVQGASRTDTGVHARGQVGLIDTTGPVSMDASGFGPQRPSAPGYRGAGGPGGRAGFRRDAGRHAQVLSVHHLHRPVPPGPPDPLLLALPGVLGPRGHAGGGCNTSSDCTTSAPSRPGWTRARTPCGRCFAAMSRRGGGDSDWIIIDVQGDGFLHHMVRLIAGTLIDIGRGRWPPEHMAEILAARTAHGGRPSRPGQRPVLWSGSSSGRSKVPRGKMGTGRGSVARPFLLGTCRLGSYRFSAGWPGARASACRYPSSPSAGTATCAVASYGTARRNLLPAPGVLLILMRPPSSWMRARGCREVQIRRLSRVAAGRIRSPGRPRTARGSVPSVARGCGPRRPRRA